MLRKVMPNFIMPNQNNFKVGKSTVKPTFIHLIVYEAEYRYKFFFFWEIDC